MPTLYILCGPSGCGKTTWADEFILRNPDIRYVSRDHIRYSLLKDDEDYFSHEGQVFRRFAGTITQTLVDGFDVIADATHLNAYSRKKLTSTIDQLMPDYEIKYIVFYTPIQECYDNNNNRSGRAHVPEETIRGMFRSFKPPTFDEDKRIVDIIEINAEKKNDFSFLITPYLKENG